MPTKRWKKLIKEIEKEKETTTMEELNTDIYSVNWESVFEREITFVTETFVFVYRATSIYIVWICLHYGVAHLYANWCAPLGWWGFLYSPFLAASPQCRALQWVIYNGGNTMEYMWATLGLWLLTKIIVRK